jgi:hypothetical protein
MCSRDFEAEEPVTLLQLDVDGGGSADMTVTLKGNHADFSNFVH